MVNAQTHVTQVSTTATSLLPAKFMNAFEDAWAARGGMDPEIYNVQGFCGRKFRLFLNNLIARLDGDARYLEVGTYMGATICPVISGNTVSAIAIDNLSWNKEGNVAATLYNNIAVHKGQNASVTVIEKDFLEVSRELPHKFNVYFYDGDHAEKSQYDGIIWAASALDDTAIILVDDWNWSGVRSGTMNAIRDLGLQIDHLVELRTSFNNEIPTPAYGGSDWHNGFMGVVVTTR